MLGVGRVSFSALGSGFGFLDFARVGFRVKEIWFGSSSGKIFLHFSVTFGCIWQKISNISQKKLLRVTRVIEKVAQVGSGQISGRVLTQPIPNISVIHMTFCFIELNPFIFFCLIRIYFIYSF